MKARVTEIDVLKGEQYPIVVSVDEIDPILGLGDFPVTSDVSDASVRHDVYITEAEPPAPRPAGVLP